MVFENKSKEINYVRYTEDRKELLRHIKIKRTIAEETNKIIAVFNNEFDVVKMDNSILYNVAMKCFMKQLEKLTEEESLEYLKKEAMKLI